MKLILKTILFLSSVTLFSCSKTSSSDEASSTSGSLSGFAGYWSSTDCFASGPNSMRVYVHLVFPEIYVAFRQYNNDLTCSGAYDLVDGNGPTVNGTLASMTTVVNVTNVPAGFVITLNQDGSNNYGLFHKTNDGVMHILSGLPTDLGADWSDWVANVDVAGFYANPDTYVAVGGGNIGVAHYNPETGF